MTILTMTGIDHTVGSDWIKKMGRMFQTPYRGNAIEFGILRSPKVGQSARYPTREKIMEICRYVYPEQLAFHLCGRYAQMVHDHAWLELCDVIDFSLVRRVQVNSKEDSAQAMLNLMQFSVYIGKPVIMQWRQPTFPHAGSLSLLQDRSGGTGALPDSWASPDSLCSRPGNQHTMGTTTIGYAGGLTPDNVVEQLNLINKASLKKGFWIDCESGIRTNDLFDKEKAEAMARAVWSFLKWPVLEP